ncbi:NAD-dependent epimerase/dehydratase family protein [Winogradskyella sp. 3972H.M.0a.05]|uniref:NAD-dependent epimerase/dehydratase family protein n=1 Tax=Winogradskyella sp. 3972H.M.0a.05 TaxID=2950277 RepID=UPI003396D230
MVIGNGLMAKTFAHYKNDAQILIFASGVSNSLETNDEVFQREAKLLEEAITQHPNSKLVYFSTCSVTDDSINTRPYVKHKLALEAYIEAHCSDFLIARLPNVVGPNGNKGTIINYLYNAVKNQQLIELWKNSERNIIDKEDVKVIVDGLIEADYSRRTINVAWVSAIQVVDIVIAIEEHLETKANMELVEKGNKFNIDTSAISTFLEPLVNEKGEGVSYLKHLLKTYY